MTDQVAELLIQPESPPLRVDCGVVRVGKSRVTLDLVIDQYNNGMTPEGLVQAYDTLELADVHASIAYFLRNREQVEDYMKRRREEANSLKSGIEAEQRLSKKDLLGRQRAGATDDAPLGE